MWNIIPSPVRKRLAHFHARIAKPYLTNSEE
jgi:hypothetical protein